jgi:hypothetical protein
MQTTMHDAAHLEWFFDRRHHGAGDGSQIVEATIVYSVLSPKDVRIEDDPRQN